MVETNKVLQKLEYIRNYSSNLLGTKSEHDKINDYINELCTYFEELEKDPQWATLGED